jgi:hypothetical protein
VTRFEHPVVAAVVALAFTADAAAAVRIAWTSTEIATWLVATGLADVAAWASVYAAAAAWYSARDAAGRRVRRRRMVPAGRPAPGTGRRSVAARTAPGRHAAPESECEKTIPLTLTLPVVVTGVSWKYNGTQTTERNGS